MTPFNSRIHRRRSMRLQGYDYAQPGAYFITLVTFQRKEFFGSIVNGIIRLSSLGQIASDEWQRSTELRPEIRLYLDEYVIMPNHIHGIVWIVPTAVRIDVVDPNQANPEQCHPHRLPRSLSSFIAGYKSSVTSRASRELNMKIIWQRNYYDHIIRSEKEFLNIWNYIDANPQKWMEDQLHS